jgi:hypothetical protein
MKLVAKGVRPLAKILHAYCLKYDWNITKGDCEITARNIIKAMAAWSRGQS